MAASSSLSGIVKIVERHVRMAAGGAEPDFSIQHPTANAVRIEIRSTMTTAERMALIAELDDYRPPTVRVDIVTKGSEAIAQGPYRTAAPTPTLGIPAVIAPAWASDDPIATGDDYWRVLTSFAACCGLRAPSILENDTRGEIVISFPDAMTETMRAALFVILQERKLPGIAITIHAGDEDPPNERDGTERLRARLPLPVPR